MTQANHTEAAFDVVALEYDFMATLFHSSDFILANLPAQRGRALDAGCGSGVLAQNLAAHFQQVVAVDLSYDLLAIAHAKRPKDNILYCQLDLENSGFSGGYDLIVSMNVFHHIADVPRLLQTFKDSLNPGGRLILTDVVSERETPPTWVYIVGAFQEYIPNWRKYGLKIANRIFRFRLSKYWLSHLAADHYLSPATFKSLYSQHLPGCTFPRPNYVIWDKPQKFSSTFRLRPLVSFHCARNQIASKPATSRIGNTPT